MRAPRERDAGGWHGEVRQGMAPVLVVEYDNAVRDMLHDLLRLCTESSVNSEL
jgi:hypothetical protein